ncbi:hypothetical protein MPLSOD_410016 [Mesorhizobium sp. SOD10]|nr:hypothetical protein MPLSOD_410016 [Mesorhizobium sp. SOD10]
MQAMRGIALINAVVLVAEVGDFTRFSNPRHLVRDIGWKAQVRLCTRYRRLSARGKNANFVNVAIAREMVGFIWSIACRFNPLQRRRDHYLTDSQQRRWQKPKTSLGAICGAGGGTMLGSPSSPL